MKKITLAISIIILLSKSYGQITLHWEKKDSVGKTKAQIYSATKLFVAENWKSSKATIQTDDLENGTIFIIGTVSKQTSSFMREATYWYSYNVKFYMKDQKYKIVVDDLQFVKSNRAGFSAIVSDKYPGGWNCSLIEKSWTELMQSLSVDMQSIIDNYAKSIQMPLDKTNDW